jgi:hypothetical protein
VICAIFGSAGALVLGWPSLKLPRTDRQVVSLHRVAATETHAYSMSCSPTGQLLAGPITG